MTKEKQSLHQKAVKLFHDINKPAMSTYMLVKVFGNNELGTEELDAISEVLNKYKKVLSEFGKAITLQEEKYFAGVVAKYTEQFDYIDGVLGRGDLNTQNRLEILNKLAEFDMKNQEFTKNVIERIA